MRWRKIAFACATALLVLATVALLALPSIAERMIIARLTALGLEDVALEVADLSFHRIRLTDVRIGERFAIDRADATFELRPPRLRTVRVSGARWEIGTTTTGFDLAPFDRLQTTGEKRAPPFDRVEVESARVILPAYGAEVELAASLDPRGLAGLDLRATAAEIELADRSLQQISLAATSTDGRSIQWNAATRSGELELALEGAARIELSPPRAQIDAELTAGGDLDLAGLLLSSVHASARITADVDSNGFSASLIRGDLAAERGTWESARFTGVRAVLPKQDDLIAVHPGEPLSFRIPQRISWKSLSLGKTALGPGSASLRFESPRSVRVQRAETRPPDGGTLWAGPVRFQLGARQIGFDLVIDHLSMKRWLDMVARGKVEGEGRMSGRVPVKISFDPLHLRLGRGELFAKPGAVLRVTDLKTAEAWIDQAVLGSDLAEVVKQRLLEALQELELSELEFRFSPRRNDVDLTVHLAGRGRRGARQEIGGLTVNFRNFGTGLNQVLRAQEEMKHDPTLDLFQ
jgi:hypothetical protein